MKSLLTLTRAVLVVLSFAVVAACGTSAAQPARDPHALVAAGATLLDVRTAAEYAAGHIDDAVLVPVAELAARMGEIPRDRPVVVYCHSGSRSARAASMLREAGYDVHDLGPMSAW